MSLTKGRDTRARIVDAAFRLAARDGLSGLSLSELAAQLGISKSGLFAHFRSKEDLQLATLQAAAEGFQHLVFKPAFTKARGLPRLRAIMENWFKWEADPTMPGGCPFVAAAIELDDREGPVREFVATTTRDLQSALAWAARLAVEEGHFQSDTDCEQISFELYGIVLAFHHASRLQRDPRSEKRARAAFNRLVESVSQPN